MSTHQSPVQPGRLPISQTVSAIFPSAAMPYRKGASVRDRARKTLGQNVSPNRPRAASAGHARKRRDPGHGGECQRHGADIYAGSWRRNRFLCRRGLPEREQAGRYPGHRSQLAGAMRPCKSRVLDKSTPMGAIPERLEQVKARIRGKVEHPFRVIKRQFGDVKVRF